MWEFYMLNFRFLKNLEFLNFLISYETFPLEWIIVLLSNLGRI